VWGSTYLAIEVAVRSLPPLLMAGMRFVAAGVILALTLRVLGRRWPVISELRGALIVGTLLLLGGNGVVCLVAHAVPSGIVALVIGCTSLFVAVAQWLLGGAAPDRRTWLGMLVGLAGVALLVAHPGTEAAWPWWGPVALLGAVASWALGTALSKKLAQPADPWMSTAMQMLLGGTVIIAVASLRGEWGSVDPDSINRASQLAWLYLVVFGSIIGFGSYIWLLRHATPAVATSYGYVNPLVALTLGATLNGEPLTTQTLIAAALIIGAVALLVTRR
jgi:drug/metabolite transporter (DMT)-like permease